MNRAKAMTRQGKAVERRMCRSRASFLFFVCFILKADLEPERMNILSRNAIDNTDPGQTDQDARSEVDLLKWRLIPGGSGEKTRVRRGTRTCSLLT